MNRESYMRRALELAADAGAAGEVPVGCVIVRNGEIVGCGRNRREECQSTASHAEMEAIAQANRTLGSWRLDECELYVTLEPCPMYLVKEGFDVRIAGDGSGAIREFEKKVPDLILLDIMLPVMDGWVVCAKIRETSKVPIIMRSSS